MSARLKVEPAIDRPDDFYEALIAAHRDLTDAQSLALNCRLILILANQIGDVDLLKDALALARRSAGAGG
jgi:hypothetical protein